MTEEKHAVARETLIRYLVGDVTTAEREAVERAMVRDLETREALGRLRRLRDRLAAAGADAPVDEHLATRVMAQIRREEQEVALDRWGAWIFPRVLAVGIPLVLLLAVWNAGRQVDPGAHASFIERTLGIPAGTALTAPIEVLFLADPERRATLNGVER